MSYKHWYDEDFFIQTFDKNGVRGEGTIHPLGSKRLLLLTAMKTEGYDPLNALIKQHQAAWEDRSFSTIIKAVVDFIAKDYPHFCFILGLWDEELSQFSSFNCGLPPVQIRTKKAKCIELTQNNTALSAIDEILIDTVESHNIDFVFASDSWLAYYLFKNEFETVNFKKDLLMLLKYYGIPEHFQGIDQFFILGNQTHSDVKISHTKSLPAKLQAISGYEAEFEHILSSFFDDPIRNGSAAVVFNELIMNAFEYGSLGIDPSAKQEAMQNEDYFQWIRKQEKGYHKNIDISIEIYQSNTLRVTIDDHGKGFDYALIDQYVCDEFDYHGRGIGMIAHMIDGLFYAKNGSQVIFFLRYDTPIWHEYSKACQLYFKTLKLLIIGDDDYDLIEKNLQYKLDAISKVSQEDDPLGLIREKRPNFIYINLDVLEDALHLAKQIRAILGDIPIILSACTYDNVAFLDAVKAKIDQIHPAFEKPNELIDAMLQTLQHRLYKEGEECFLDQHAKEDIRAQHHYYQEQQSKAFEKQKLVIHDDSEKLSWMQNKLLYRPMEIVSGDIYSLFRVNDDCFISYIIDSMGKGIAASVTAILSAAFINRSIVLSRDFHDFNIERVVSDFIGFVTPNLLEDEVLSCSFVFVNKKNHELKHVSFGMYPLLIKDRHKRSFQVLKSPHPPLMNFALPYTIETVRLPLKFELLIYSDGLCEMEGFTIGSLIELFSQSKDYNSFNHQLESILQAQEQTDDISMLFVSV